MRLISLVYSKTKTMISLVGSSCVLVAAGFVFYIFCAIAFNGLFQVGEQNLTILASEVGLSFFGLSYAIFLLIKAIIKEGKK